MRNIWKAFTNSLLPQKGEDDGSFLAFALVALVVLLAGQEAGWCVESATQGYVRQPAWPGTMLATRAALNSAQAGSAPRERREHAWQQLEGDFPREMDWWLQDFGPDPVAWLKSGAGTTIERRAIVHVLDELGAEGKEFRGVLDELTQANVPSDDARWLNLYAKACQCRREIRLRPLLTKWQKIVFTKHHNMGGSHYAYTEAQSDAQAERTFHPGAALCVLELSPTEGPPVLRAGAAPALRVRTLLEAPDGVIRDPDIAHDGRRILFSWKKSDRNDDYHLYEMDVASGQTRQLTSGLGYADYEGQYLPNGDIIFSSTRCVQTTDCFTTEVSNLYTCDKDGKYMRRLGFDQVHTNYPTVLNDGRVVYTRWEYNDRGQIFVQGLMQMNPDGTGQTEFYGMNSWFPTTLLHSRAIPGSHQAISVASGHHSRQAGKLVIVDNHLGFEENSGVRLIAPVRKTEAVHVDGYGQSGELFQYPYALSEREYLVTYTPYGWSRQPTLFGIYFMDMDGRRELLASDPKTSCNQPVPLAPRLQPPLRPSSVDYGKTTGTYHMQDIYAGPGLAGIPRGTIKRLRVVALDYRLALIGANGNEGPAGAAMVATPVAIGHGCWDAKIVLGDATVYQDNSAFFEVPARTPVYFQALDEQGRMVQSMRSWSTLQPGENASCVGCHENKGTTPLARAGRTCASAVGPQKLMPFHGSARGFSFPREIQPILDKHCVSCHDDRTTTLPLGTVRSDVPSAPAHAAANPKSHSFSLLGVETVDPPAKRKWSDAYLALTQAKIDSQGKHWAAGRQSDLVTWINAQSAPPLQPPYSTGAAKSRLLTLLEKGHYEAKLSAEEMEKLACWIDLAVPYCGDYLEANTWTPADMKRHERLLRKRNLQEDLEHKSIEELMNSRLTAVKQP